MSNLPDRVPLRILAQLRASAGAHTKLLLGEMYLPYACRADDNTTPSSDDLARSTEPLSLPFAPADSPLLPNLGRANVHGYLTDLMVRYITPGRSCVTVKLTKGYICYRRCWACSTQRSVRLTR